MAKPQRKTAHTTIRVREQSRFAIEFWSRLKRQSANEWMEQACEFHADELARQHGLSWRGLWHIEPAVRELRTFLLDDAVFPFTNEQELVRNFVMLHRAFFYDEKRGALSVNVPRAVALWPIVIDVMNQSGDFWDKGKALAAALNAAGFEAPVWPPVEDESAT